MAIRINPDGSMTVGMILEEPKEEKPEVKAKKPRRTARVRDKGEG